MNTEMESWEKFCRQFPTSNARYCKSETRPTKPRTGPKMRLARVIYILIQQLGSGYDVTIQRRNRVLRSGGGVRTGLTLRISWSVVDQTGAGPRSAGGGESSGQSVMLNIHPHTHAYTRLRTHELLSSRHRAVCRTKYRRDSSSVHGASILFNIDML